MCQILKYNGNETVFWSKWKWVYQISKFVGYRESHVLEGIMASNVYIRKKERSWVNGLGFHLKKLGKAEEYKTKIRRRKEW